MRIFKGTIRAFFLFAAFLSAATVNKAAAQEFMVSEFSNLSPAALLPHHPEQLSKMALDCSHLVHYLFSRAGLPYPYAPSHKLYSGAEGFRHVRQPRAGDLIVWRGHVGIVVDPQQHSFLSALRSGVKVVSYSSRYWQMKGQPRFFRYAKANSPELWQRDDTVPGQTVYRSSSAE